MTAKRAITRADILAPDVYARQRASLKRRIAALKRNRRVEIGPDATLYFESYDTMWMQVHEMLYIERGGDDQIAGELAAYNPMIPQGRELVATLMIEIDSPARRRRTLATLGGIEASVTLEIGGATVRAVPETDVERTTAEGIASSVHFLHFPLTDDQAARFKAPGARVVIAIGHPSYGHMAVMPEAVRAALAEDLD